MADIAPELGKLSTGFEERTLAAYQNVALEEVQKEHKPYFDALEQHPRMLVGKKVPGIGKEGDETLSDERDAASWQEAVKQTLAAEVRSRASKALDDNKGFLDTVHASISLFQDNVDLVPGTKEFDNDLAERFVTLAEPYELRVDGKLQGYSIAVQPLVNQLRAQIAAERTAAAAAPTSTTAAAAAPPAAPAATPPEQPQAGIPSKAGSGGDKEEFSTLFGTIGLPDLRF